MTKRFLWIAATIAFAWLFVAGGLWVSAARADLNATPRTARPAQPAAPPVAALLPAPAPSPTADYTIRRVLDIPGSMRPGDWHWDEVGAPADGPVVITADLKAQTISVFRGGYEIGAAVILYGADDKPTPLGIFPITQKKRDHVSNLYGAPMPFMQRLTNDGVAIHGSPVVGPNLATHGCIGVPIAFAAKLFGVTKVGDKVIITDGEMLAEGGAITAVK